MGEPRPLRGACLKMARRLSFGYWRGQGAGRASRAKSDLTVSPVAEGLVFRLSAAAQADGFAAREIESIAVHVVDGEVPFDANRAVIADSDFCWHFSHRNRSGLGACAANCCVAR